MEKVLVTGSAGFIGGYLVDELLKQGYSVTGLDNLSKYGRVSRSFDENPNFRFVEGDAADVEMFAVIKGGIVAVQPEENATRIVTVSSKILDFIVTLFLLFYLYLES